MHLTSILPQIRGKAAYFKGVIPKRAMKAIDIPVVNQLPRWVIKYKDYATFGKFVDYMIRKILITHFPHQIIEGPIQAATVSQMLSESVTVHDASEIPVGGDPTLNYVILGDQKEAVDRFVAHRDEHIRAYLDPNFPWQECLPQLYYLAVLDGFYGFKRFLFPDLHITPDVVRTSYAYFEAVERWLIPLFQTVKTIYLNPTLSHPQTFGGEADLAVTTNDRFTLLDIKCSWSTARLIRRYYCQLLGYAAMDQFLYDHATREEYPIIGAGPVNAIGFLLPSQLKLATQDISEWEGATRLQFLKKLQSVQYWPRNRKP
jgi:hypothetical protein